jgi:hypothetical protein
VKDLEPTESGDQTSEINQLVEPPENENSFHGTCFFGHFGGRKVKVWYKTSQLERSVYPDLCQLLTAHEIDLSGYDSSNIVQILLRTVMFGGSIVFRGPTFINGPMEDILRKERDLVRKIVITVFNKEEHKPYQMEVTPIEEVDMSIQYDSAIEHRVSTTIFQPVGYEVNECYRVIIEGNGNEPEKLKHHVFHFHPSDNWLNRRYPSVQ